ncbi:MAG: hypothetical protein R3362_13040, partial [Rhodothermales bacterium]|nr:hypothetical protein [Rhodothermales bacterium]
MCPHLGAGGTQRVISTLTDAWARRGRRMLVVTLYEEEAVYALDPSVRTVCLHTLMQAARGPGRIRRWLRGWLLESALGQRLAGLRARMAASPLGAWGGWATLYRVGGASKRAARNLVGAVLFLALRTVRYNGEYLYSLRLARTLRRVLRAEGAPVVMAFIGKTNVVTVLACLGLGRRVVISERNDPARQKLAGLWDGLRERLYGRADVVTANS